ncbi:MAG: hypothetical protein LC754_03970 [Acidobacteria bacterium]|nr:hypothetical protein [Acidobacteriota bacterium]
MPGSSAGQFMPRDGRARPPQAGARRRNGPHPRMPSTVGYMVAAGGLSVALFLAIWYLLREDGDNALWIAGLVAGFVILVAAGAREVVMRRAWARYTREMESEMRSGDSMRRPVKQAGMQSSVHASATALRALQQRLAEADVAGATPEAQLEAYRLCEQYLANSEEVLRAATAADMRAALRSGQERVRPLQKKYLLAWARGESTRLTHEAQRRVRLSDRIETAQRALEVLDEALRVYPGEQELSDSSTAVRNFIASIKVGQWVEMAERAAFRGKYVRAVARYRDALFYLSRADMGEDAREEAANRIQREIELLRARLATGEPSADPTLVEPRQTKSARRVSRVEEEASLDKIPVEGNGERIL